MQLERVLAGAAELILGGRCAGCSRPGPASCSACAARVRSSQPLLVSTSYAERGVIVAAGEYRGELKQFLISAKERQALSLLPLLGERLAVSVAALAWAGLPVASAEPVVLVPVPSARAVVAGRGLDFTATLARMAAGQLRAAGVNAVTSGGLRQRRRLRDQAGLGLLARQENLRGAFRASRLPKGVVIVVDDIVTTGASLAEARRALEEAGREVLGAATVAATMRNRGAR